MILTLLGGGCAFLTGLALGYGIGLRAAEDTTEEVVDTTPPPTAKELRFASHEAGHAIVAWHNPYVRSITQISIVPGGLTKGKWESGGHIRYKAGASTHAAALWHDVAVSMGGVAGEVAHCGRFRGGTAIADLQQARDVADRLIQLGSPRPPWMGGTPDPKGFDFTKPFVEGTISPEAAVILSKGYARAKGLIRRQRSTFDRLVQATATRKTLNQREIDRILRPKWFHL